MSCRKALQRSLGIAQKPLTVNDVIRFAVIFDRSKHSIRSIVRIELIKKACTKQCENVDR